MALVHGLHQAVAVAFHGSVSDRVAARLDHHRHRVRGAILEGEMTLLEDLLLTGKEVDEALDHLASCLLDLRLVVIGGMEPEPDVEARLVRPGGLLQPVAHILQDDVVTIHVVLLRGHVPVPEGRNLRDEVTIVGFEEVAGLDAVELSVAHGSSILFRGRTLHRFRAFSAPEGEGVTTRKPAVDVPPGGALMGVVVADLAHRENRGTVVVVHYRRSGRAANAAVGVAEVGLNLVVVHGYSISF